MIPMGFINLPAMTQIEMISAQHRSALSGAHRVALRASEL